MRAIIRTMCDGGATLRNVVRGSVGIGRLAMALLLAASCSRGVSPPTQAPSTGPTTAQAAGCVAVDVTSPSASPVPTAERMTLLTLDTTTQAVWASVPSADCIVASRSGDEPVRLAGDAVTFTWSETPFELDLTKATVQPRFYVVTAFRAGRQIRRFAAFVPCPRLVFVAARGSGQNGLLGEAYAAGLGDRARRVLEHLREGLQLDRRALPAVAVDYPAVAVGVNPDLTLRGGDAPRLYRESVEDGVRAARLVLARIADRCPDGTRMVLFGYSQGAQVMGDAFAQSSAEIRARVARVILFADATYAPGDQRVTYLPFALRGDGIKGPRSRFPNDDGAVVESWCWSGDAICQRPRRGWHVHGPAYDAYESDAADRAVAALRA